MGTSDLYERVFATNENHPTCKKTNTQVRLTLFMHAGYPYK